MNKKSNFRPLTSDKTVTTKRDFALESLLHSEHFVEIEKMAVGGDGVARIQHQGKSVVVFISKSAPGDTLKIKIFSAEKNFLNGFILQVVKPGPHRRLPPCTYAFRCGGCSWQQLTEDEQLRQKENLLNELLRKFISDCTYLLQKSIASPKNFDYRNRIQLKQQGLQLGYFEDKSHEIVDIEACLIADSRISAEIPKLKSVLKPSESTQKFELKINQENNFEYLKIGEKGQGLSFSQVNTDLNSILVKKVVEIAQELKPQSITELFAGSGNFTFELCLGLPRTTIEAVELNPLLTRAATKKINSENLQKRVLFFTADCESYVFRRPLSEACVLVDPPRAGCSDIILEKLIQSKTQNILYISCHPVSLARDLQKLELRKNGYTIKWLQIYDMFPQTDHFETLIWLQKDQT